MIFLVVVTAVLLSAAQRDNLFHLSIMSGHFAFWVSPVIILYANGAEIEYISSSYCFLGLIVAMAVTHAAPRKRRRMVTTVVPVGEMISQKYNSALFIVAVVLFNFFLIITDGNSFLYTVGILIVFMTINLNSKALGWAVFVYLASIACLSHYAFLYWAGYGRLIVLGILLTMTIVFITTTRFRPFVKVVISCAVPLGTVAGSLIRSDARTFQDAIRISMQDSNVSPLLMLERIFYSSGVNNIDVWGWIDQALLFFTIFIPRSIWEGKPFGFGFQYTVDNLDRYLVEAGHSIAATFAGESIYYLGTVWGAAGTVISATMLAGLYNLVCRSRVFYGYGTVIVAAWVPTFYWGGMASFSARFWLSFIPAALFAIALRAYARRQHRVSGKVIRTIRSSKVIEGRSG